MYAAIGTNTGLSQLFAKAKRFVVWFGKNMAKTQRLDTNIVNMSAESLKLWLAKFIQEVCKGNGQSIRGEHFTVWCVI